MFQSDREGVSPRRAQRRRGERERREKERGRERAARCWAAACRNLAVHEATQLPCVTYACQRVSYITQSVLAWMLHVVPAGLLF